MKHIVRFLKGFAVLSSVVIAIFSIIYAVDKEPEAFLAGILFVASILISYWIGYLLDGYKKEEDWDNDEDYEIEDDED